MKKPRNGKRARRPKPEVKDLGDGRLAALGDSLGAGSDEILFYGRAAPGELNIRFPARHLGPADAEEAVVTLDAEFATKMSTDILQPRYQSLVRQRVLQLGPVSPQSVSPWAYELLKGTPELRLLAVTDQ